MVLSYLKVSDGVFWNDANEDSFILRTIGVQAVLDILRKLAARSYADKDISVAYFTEKIDAARKIDFSAERFRNPSGSGRTVIRRAIEEATGLI